MFRINNSLKICYASYVDSTTGDNTTPSKPVNSVFIYNLIGSKTLTFWEGRTTNKQTNTNGTCKWKETGNIATECFRERNQTYSCLLVFPQMNFSQYYYLSLPKIGPLSEVSPHPFINEVIAKGAFLSKVCPPISAEVHAQKALNEGRDYLLHCRIITCTSVE